MLKREFSILLVLIFPVLCCAQKPEKEGADGKLETGTGDAVPKQAGAPAAKTPDTSPAAAEKDDFAKQLAEVKGLMDDAEFDKATALVRKMNAAFTESSQKRTIRELTVTLNAQREAARGLAFAVENLGSNDKATVRVATDKICEAEDVGKLFLRKAVRTGSGQSAAVAADLLGQLRDVSSIPLFIERIKANPSGPLIGGIFRALRTMVGELQTEQFLLFYGLLKDDPKFERREAAGLMQSIYKETCKGNVKEFISRIGDPGCYDLLRDYFERALVSGNGEAVQFACEFGDTFCPTVNGLEGCYYSDTEFRTVALKRHEPYIFWPDSRKFPFPDGRQENVSIRWTGFVQIDTPGDYAFYAAGDDKCSVAIDDKQVVYSEGWREQEGRAKLEKGMHSIRVDFVQTTGDSRVWVQWAGPGIGKSAWLPYRQKPSPDVMGRLNQAIAALSSTNWADVRNANQLLMSSGDAGRVFMRHAVLAAPDKAVGKLVENLARADDSRAPLFLVKRLEKKADWALLSSIADGMRSLAKHVRSEELVAFDAAIKSDSEFKMCGQAAALCGVLDRVCNGSSNIYNKAVGDDAAYDRLKDYVLRALDSKDESLVAWAASYGQPFAPLAQGLHARYYEGEGFDNPVLERVDGTIAVNEKQFPIPSGRQDGISARWQGFLQADQTADFGFSIKAENTGRLWINDSLVVQEGGNRGDERQANFRLNAGRNALLAEFQEWTGVSTMLLYWWGPNIGKEHIRTGSLLTYPWMGLMLDVSKAIRQLPDKNAAVSGPARGMIQSAGLPGRIFLRKALRDEPEPVAREAVQMLIDVRDPQAAPFLLARLKGDPKAEESRSVLDGLSALAETIPPGEFPWLLEKLRQEKTPVMSPYSAALCAALERVCHRDEGKFNDLVKQADGLASLSAYVLTCLGSDDMALVARACEYGVPLTPYMNGIRGSYFEGRGRERMVLERVDSQVLIENGKFPGMATNRQENLSARWTGSVSVHNPGDYVFFMFTPQYAELWLDGALILAGGAGNQQLQRQIRLEKGFHAVRVNYSHGAGDSTLFLDWQGPDAPARQRLTGAWLRTPAWEAELSQVSKTVGNLASQNAAEAAAAQSAIHRTDPISRIFLRNMIQRAPDDVASKAVEMLVYRDDGDMVPALLKRLKQDPKKAAERSVCEGLAAMATRLGTNDFPELFAQLQADGGAIMGAPACALCAALQNVCRGNKEKFNSLVGNQNGYDLLKAHVEKAFTLQNADVVARACEFGAPFAPLAVGLRGRYYEGWDPEVLVLERLDGQLHQDPRKFPHPRDRQDNVCAVWTGYVYAHRPGDYMFRTMGINHTRLRINGKVVLESTGNDIRQNLSLAQGLHALRFDFQHGGGDSSFMLNWQGPDFGEQRFAGAWLQTPLWRSEIAKIEAAVKEAGGDDFVKRGPANDLIRANGLYGVILQRNAVRYDDDKVAIAAAEALAGQYDPEVAALLIQRLKKAPNSPVVMRLVSALAQLAPRLDDQQCAWLNGARAEMSKINPKVHFAAMCAVLEKRCMGDKDAFNKIVNDPAAYDALRDAVAAMLKSDNKDAVAWGCENAGHFAPLMTGIRGQYYEGRHFEKPVADRREVRLEFANRGFPMPNNRQDDISAIWTGLMEVKKAGLFLFKMKGDDGFRLWVDGKLTVDGWLYSAGQERSGSIELKPGMHPIEIRFYQTTGDSGLTVWFKGPDMEGPLDERVLRTHSWAGDLGALQAELQKFVAGNDQQLNEAKARVKGWGEVGRQYLFNMIRYEPSGTMDRVVRFLKEQSDVRFVPLIAERRGIEQDQGLMTALENQLKDAVDGIPDTMLPAIFQALTQDSKYERRHMVDFFASVLAKKCKNDRKRFRELVKDNEGDQRIVDYVFKAQGSADEKIRSWAINYTGPFAR